MQFENENVEFKSQMLEDLYENMRTMGQELTFEAAEGAFSRYHVDFSDIKARVSQCAC